MLQVKQVSNTWNFYFGEKFQDTQRRFDAIASRQRRTRTGTLDYLVRYYEKNEERKLMSY